jgi:uncharacterized protein YciI
MRYEVAAGAMPLAQKLFPLHKARLDEFHARGVLLMVGAMEDPRDGAMGIFTTREAAEEFVGGDPFVLEGVVAKHTISAWNEVLLK